MSNQLRWVPVHSIARLRMDDGARSSDSALIRAADCKMFLVVTLAMSRAAEGQRRGQRHGRVALKRGLLITPRPHWPPLLGGLSMEIAGEFNFAWLSPSPSLMTCQCCTCITFQHGLMAGGHFNKVVRYRFNSVWCI